MTQDSQSDRLVFIVVLHTTVSIFLASHNNILEHSTYLMILTLKKKSLDIGYLHVNSLHYLTHMGDKSATTSKYDQLYIVPWVCCTCSELVLNSTTSTVIQLNWVCCTACISYELIPNSTNIMRYRVC